MVAAASGVKLPKIQDKESMKDALRSLASITTDGVLAVEVLWTPEAEGDYYTRDELIVDYPKMVTL